MLTKYSTPSEIAEASLEAIRESGWARGDFGNPKKGFCLMGGARYQKLIHTDRIANAILPGISEYQLAKAEDNIRNEWEASPWVKLVIEPQTTVAVVNDKVLTSQQEAEDILMAAAKYWRNKGE